MTDQVVVFVTFENAEQARAIAETVVREKLAACVNLIGAVQSCYVWEEKLTWSNEVMGLMKTTKGRFRQLDARIRSLHGYDTPEIVCVEIDDGSEKYLEWVDRSVGGKGEI